MRDKLAEPLDGPNSQPVMLLAKEMRQLGKYAVHSKRAVIVPKAIARIFPVGTKFREEIDEPGEEFLRSHSSPARFKALAEVFPLPRTKLGRMHQA